jgi:hypothetical protein
MATGEELDRVRSELRRLGYLDHGFERFLLQDALRPRAPLGTVLRLTARVALLAGGVTAAALALALVAANGGFSTSPLDVAALFLHLFFPISAAAGLGFLALCGLVLLVLRLYPVRRIEAVSLAVAAAVGVSALGLALWGARELVREGQRPLLIVLAVAAPIAVTVLVRLVYQGLLTLAIRFTDSTPRGSSLISRRGLGMVILAAAFLLTIPAVLSARREPPPPPPSLPSAPGDRVLLLGIDGVLPEELDYLLAAGDLPGFGRLAREGGRVWRYRREAEPPASFWTGVATGIPGPDHGVTSLDSFRPLGVEAPLARTGPLRLWWSGVEVPLGLAEYRPVLANRRRAFTIWELASRGGGPVLAVNWWGTFPAEPLPGLVVAHGAFQLLEEGAQGAIAPDLEKSGAENLVRDTRNSKGDESHESDRFDRRLAAALPPAAAASVQERALLPDRFYRRIFEERLAAPSGTPRAAALYLPGLDIAADGWRGGDVAFADLVRSELTAADRLLAGALQGIGTVAVVLDPGRRREGGEGRVLIWRRSGCGAPRRESREIPEIVPEAVASALLRALGLPQSRELPAPPADCRWAPAHAVIPGYGEPRQRQASTPEGGEYLESLRSLGYL